MKSLLIALLLLLAPLASSQQPPNSDTLAITHVTIINLNGEHSQPEMTVLIHGGKISAIGKTGQSQIPANATQFDGTAKFLIPGLWDMHVHILTPERDFPMFIANGVLGVRNMGAVPKDVFQWKADVASGRVLGPRMVACGPVVDGPHPAHPEHAISVTTADDGRRAVASLKEMGADFVKVYDGLSRDAYFAIVQESKRVGLPFAGHVPGSISQEEASNAGQRSIEHGIAALPTLDYEKNKPAPTGYFEEAMRTKNFSLIPEGIAKEGNAELDHFSPQRTEELYKTFVKNGTYLTPTRVVDRGLTFIDDLSKQEDPRLQYVPASMREDWKPQNGMLTRYRTPAYIAFRKRKYDMTTKQMLIAHRLGVAFLAGTDVSAAYTYPGFSLHDELALFVEAGFTPLESLRTATVNPAQFFGMTDSMGSIEVGKTADLVVVDANPLADISNTKRISAVIVEGRLLKKSNLDALLQKAQAAAKSLK
jgi:imidazolonepropionase-like amidohydrolase